ncbi:hypothetical protein C0J50_4185 [Silurus asotus]|uniref:Uncharacterized protein n=1 Tax=Silurus asotus TaxID=30991 RepID=A0AAD5FEE1_SILAS|nr:hypothetical protein C0J50_4185 [Silurus asotus]
METEQMLVSGSDCQSRILIVRIGENATIKCRSNAGQDGVYLYFQKKETNTVTVLYYYKDGTLTLEDTFKDRVGINKNLGDFSVVLSHVKTTDQGVYWCKFNKEDVYSDSEKTTLFIQPKTGKICVTENIPVTKNIPVTEERCLFTVSWGVICGQSVLILLLVFILVKLWHDRGNYTPKQQPSNGVYEDMRGHTKMALQNPAYESSQRCTRSDLI